MIEFPDSPTTGDLHAAGGASWRWDGVKWTVDTAGPLLGQGEVLGNPNPADAEAIPADLPLVLRAALGDGVAGQAILSGGPAVDPAWGDLPTVPTPPVLHQGEVLGNPNAPDGGAVPADLPLMLRAAIGDGVAGQALLSGGPAIDPAWGSLPTVPTPPVLHQGDVLGNPSVPDGGAVAASLEAMLRAALGDGVAGQAILSGGPAVDPAWGQLPTEPTRQVMYVGGVVLGSSQLLGMHKMARAATFPANFAGSQAGGSAAATASVVVTVERALAASPTTFSSVGTITIAAGTITPTFASSGIVAPAIGDVLRVVGPAVADLTFANFYCTIVES
jgi:hypothetical protein